MLELKQNTKAPPVDGNVDKSKPASRRHNQVQFCSHLALISRREGERSRPAAKQRAQTSGAQSPQLAGKPQLAATSSSANWPSSSRSLPHFPVHASGLAWPCRAGRPDLRPVRAEAVSARELRPPASRPRCDLLSWKRAPNGPASRVSAAATGHGAGSSRPASNSAARFACQKLGSSAARWIRSSSWTKRRIRALATGYVNNFTQTPTDSARQTRLAGWRVRAARWPQSLSA